jgi:8-oxo-dGTP pyrophosphatase MutT (NUDIX family)
MTERSFPNLWEVPGGSPELSDPTILHSVAREAFEETGLRLTKFVRQIGDGVEFNTGPKKRERSGSSLALKLRSPRFLFRKQRCIGT